MPEPAAQSEPTAQSVMEKFEFYFLALSFTLLGASIQTADFSTSSAISIGLELIGWSLLTLSGITGLSKIQWIASILSAKSKATNLQGIAEQLTLNQKQGSLTVFDVGSGKDVPIGEVISGVKKRATQYSDLVAKYGKWNGVKHHIQWYSFIMGLLAVGVARAVAAIC